MASWRIRFHDKWPHLASLYASTHNLDEEGKYPDPIMGQDNVFDPSEPYGAYRYYIHPTGARSEFSLEEPTYVNRPVYKDEESRSSDYTSGESLRRGSTCRVLLCVFLVLSFIGVVVAAITLAVLLSKTPRSRKLADAPIEEYESMASLLGRTFNESLLDKNSDDYKQLEKELCIALEQIFKEPDSPVKHEFAGCEVIEFAEGSVLARFRIKLQPKLPEGFKKELRIRQKIEEHFSKKIKEHGPWQSVKFNPDFIRRFVKIEPPKVETSPPTTAPTSEGTTSTKTVKPGIIDVTTKPINITESTEPVSTASPSVVNETVTIGATTIKDENLTVSTSQMLEGTTVTSNVTQTLAPSTESPVSTIDDMVIIKETKASVSNVSEVEITNFTVPETLMKVTKEVKIMIVADVINVTTTTIDPFILFENVTFPFNDSTSTDFGIDDVGNATTAEEVTAATVDAGTITTTAKVGTESTASPTDTATEATTGDMRQTTVAPVSPDGTTVVEGVTSMSTLELNQTTVITERPSTVEQSSETVTPVDKTNVTQLSITTESVLNDTTDFASLFNETTEFAIDPTQTFEITTPADKTMDITTSTAGTLTPTVPEQTTMAVGTTGSVDVTTLLDSVTNESISDKISTMRDGTTLGATGMLPSDTTLKPVSDVTLTTVQDKTTQGERLTTESVSEVQSTIETVTGDLLANITNTTEFGFLETTTAENVTEPDMVFITDSTSNETTTIADQTFEKVTTSAPVVTHSITTDSVLMTTMPQQAAITTETLTDSTMLAATTGIDTIDSLTTLESQSITTDGQMPETTNGTDATPQTTQIISEMIQKDTVAAVDRAPQTFVMQDTTQQAGTTTVVSTVEQTTAYVDNITVTDGGVTIIQEATTQINFTEITTIEETSVLPETTPSQTVSSPVETTMPASQATVSPDQGLTTSLTDTTQEGTTSDTIVAATTMSETTPAMQGTTVDTATTMPVTESVTTAQTELQQNVTTTLMYENITATDMITTTDSLNETLPIDSTSENMTTTVSASLDLTTTLGDATTVESVPATTMFPMAASTQADMTATAVDQATTQTDTKSTNITASMTETTVSDTAPSTPGQSTEVIQSTQMPSQLIDTITTLQPTGITTLVTDTMVNVTELPTQIPEQKTMGDIATALNLTDLSTVDVLLDNTTATETLDMANFTTVAVAQDKLTTSKQMTSTLISDKITEFTTSAPDNDTTMYSDTTMLPEQTPTMPDTAISTLPSNDSFAMTTSKDGSMNVSDIVSTDSGVTVDVLTQQPQTTVSDAALSTDQSLSNGTDTAQSTSIDTTQAPASTDPPVTTLVAETTMSATGDVSDTTVQTDSSTAAPSGTIAKTTETPGQTVAPVVDMATTDMLLNFTDMYYNVTDLYENVTDDAFTTDMPRVTTSKPFTSDQSVTNVTDTVQQVTTLLVNMSEPVTDTSVTDGVTVMPPDNGTVTADLTTQTTKETTTTILSVNATTENPTATDGFSLEDNATMIMDPTTQGTFLSNTTLASETFTTDSSATEQPTNISGLISEGSNATITIKESTQSNVTKVSSSNVTAESLAPEELSNITSAPRIDSKMSETINMTESPFTENATIYDMTFENTTDFYYLNETTTSVISNATISDSATVILPDLSSSNETVDIKPSSNETTLSSEVKANESAITFEMFSSLPLN